MNKKQIAIYIIIAVVFFFIGGCVGSYTQYKKNIETEYQDIKGNDVENSKETNNSKVKLIGLNQEEVFSNIEMKVLKAEESNGVNNESGTSKPSGKFIVLELELKNNDKQAIQYSSDQFMLTSGDSIYQVDDTAFDAMGNLNNQESIFNKNQEFIGAYDNFNPGMSKKTYLVFDVPKNVTLENSKLMLTDNKEVAFSLK